MYIFDPLYICENGTVTIMSALDMIEEMKTDLERGIPTPDLQNSVIDGIEPPLNERPREITHTDADLLERAREINASGKFIFTCFSEMNTFLLLRSQDAILKLQNKLHDRVQTWTDDDSENLQAMLRQYRISKNLFSTNPR